LNLARDIGASASYRDGNRYREFPLRDSGVSQHAVLAAQIFYMRRRAPTHEPSEICAIDFKAEFSSIRILLSFRDYRQQLVDFFLPAVAVS
jgi:hypothetical protein